LLTVYFFRIIYSYLASIRNHALLNIAFEDSRLFITKERAPFMICLELYRPEELKLAAKELKNNNYLAGFGEKDHNDLKFESKTNSVRRFIGMPITPMNPAEKVHKFCKQLDKA
jgi:hypothetical protein